MSIAGADQFPVYVNRDLMATISPRVRDDCPGAKSFIIFNGSTPGRCVAETPRQVMEKPCFNGRPTDKPD